MSGAVFIYRSACSLLWRQTAAGIKHGPSRTFAELFSSRQKTTTGIHCQILSLQNHHIVPVAASSCSFILRRLFSSSATQRATPVPNDNNYTSSFQNPRHISYKMAKAHTDRDILPQDVEPLHYSLSVYNIDTKNFTFSGTVGIDVFIHGKCKSIPVNAKELEIKEGSIVTESSKTQASYKTTSVDINAEQQRATLNFPEELPTGTKATIVIEYSGKLNNEMAGFYRSKYKTPEGVETHMYSTQFESCDARRAFPCFDEPNLKATFDFKITIPAHWTALSNMPVESSKSPTDGKKMASSEAGELKEVTFQKAPKMSTYLYAWACGDFEYIETFTERKYNGKSLPVRVYSTKGLISQGQFALQNAAKIVDYFSEVFQIDYPLPKVDLLAVHEFSHGAMENWGLITYRTTAVLYDEANSDIRYKNRVAYVVAHELAHQWFGNLVTMDWWSELWLNEGFATWVGWLAIDHFYPDWDVWGQFVSESMQTGFNLDSLRGSHPIEVPVRDALEVDQIFDHISYLKGSSTIRMLSSYLGVETFLKGVAAYLKKHQFSNATTNDLWAALSEASGKDVNSFMENWIKQIGFPVLEVTEAADSLSIKQKRFLSTGDCKAEEDQTTWWVPLGLTSQTYKSASEEVTALTEKEVVVKNLNTDFYKLNYGQNGFYRVNYPPERLAKLGSEFKKLSVADRIGLVADAAAMAISGAGTTPGLLALVEGTKDEDNYLVWSQILNQLGTVRSAFSESGEDIKEALKKFTLDLVSPAAEKIGFDFPEGEPMLTSQLRALLLGAAADAGHEKINAELKRQFDAYMGGDKSAVNPALKLKVLRSAVGNGGKDEFDLVWNEYMNTSSVDGKEITLTAMGRAKEPEVVKAYLLKLLTDDIPTQNTHYAIQSLAANSHARPHLWEFVKSEWDAIYKLLGGNMVLLDRFVRMGCNKFSDEDTLKDMISFFEPKDQRGYDRAVKICIDTVTGNVNWVQRDSNAVMDWLSEKGYGA